MGMIGNKLAVVAVWVVMLCFVGVQLAFLIRKEDDDSRYYDLERTVKMQQFYMEEVIDACKVVMADRADPAVDLYESVEEMLRRIDSYKKSIEYLKSLTEEVKDMQLDLQVMKVRSRTKEESSYNPNPLGIDLNSMWRKRAIDVAIDRLRRSPMRGDIMDVYEFGVFTGNSMREMATYVMERNYSCHMWGFDSFVGLPREDNTGNKHWEESFFNAMEGLKNPSPSQTRDIIQEKIRREAGFDNVTLITGFFSTSLTPWLREKYPLRKALYIDIDTDIYTGAVQAMDWIFANDLVIPNITVIGYDDFMWSDRAKTFGDGEARAHKEMTEKYRVKFTYLPPVSQGIVFAVDGIGVDDHTVGSGYF